LSVRRNNHLRKKEHIYIDACIEEYYIPPKMLEIEIEGGVDIDDVNAE
jgi:hypothetical protein